MTDSNAARAFVSRRRTWLTFLVLVVVIVAGLPWLLAKTTLRDRMLNAIAGSDDIVVSSTDASFGYLSSLSLSGLRIQSTDRFTQIDVARIQADRSWVGLLLSRPDLGTFCVEGPRAELLVDPKELARKTGETEDPKAPAKITELPSLTAEIVDASILVRTPASGEPPIDLKGIDLTLRIEQKGEIPVIRVEPSTVFDHEKITPALCGQGLQLIAPLLADEVAAEGAFSLRLEQCEIPIGGDPKDRNQALSLRGELQLHEGNVSLRNTIAKTISEALLKVVGKGFPDRLTVAKDLVVDFEVVDGRVRHEGLALLLPNGDSSIEFTSSGSVGLDETLDLLVNVKLPNQMLGGGQLIQALTKAPIVFAISGTLDQPKIELAKGGSGLIDSVRDLAAGETPTEESQETLNEAISGAVDVVGGILGGLRDRAQQRREAQESSAEPSGENPTENSAEESSLLPNLRQRLRDRSLLRNRRESETPSQPSEPPPASQPIDL